MHGSMWRREETRPVGPARAARSRRLSPTLHKVVFGAPRSISLIQVGLGILAFRVGATPGHLSVSEFFRGK
jgi:hypothetical protein